MPPPAGGSVLVVDVRSGAILAAASGPRFSLAEASQRDPEFWNAVTLAVDRPLFDRIGSMALPPGSVFKIATAIASMELGKLDPNALFECRGFLHRPDRHRDYIFRHQGVGHGPLTLSRALAESCNVYFFALGEQLGEAPLAAWATTLGFGRRTGIDVPGESTGQVTSRQQSDAIGLAVGQASLTATPLQVARLMAVVANGERLVTPHFARGGGLTADSAESFRPLLSTESISFKYSATVKQIREGLERGVASASGTAHQSTWHSQVAIAGKTGTAETGGGLPDHAWFAGYLPASDPQYAIVVALEYGGAGGKIAGPVAKGTADALLRRGFLRNDPNIAPAQPKQLARLFLNQ